MSKLQPYATYYPVQYDYVSQLPEDWQLLPNIAIFIERIERGFDNEELLSVTIGKGVIRQSDVDVKKDSSNEDKSKYKLIKVGDIAYNRMRMWQGALGYSDYQGITSPAYVVLKPKMEMNQRFFHYMFRTPFYTNYSKRFSYGIVDDQLSLRYVDFKRMYSIVPPLETQNAIVAYLDRKTQQIQEFIAKKERLIKTLLDRKHSIKFTFVTKGIDTNRVFKDVDLGWTSKIPQDWDLLKIKYCISKITSGITPSMDNQAYWNGYIPWVSPKDMKSDTISNSQLFITENALRNTAIKLVPINSILLVVRSGILQRTLPTSICKKEVTINQDLKAITVDKNKLLPKYFQLVLQGLENSILYESRKAVATVESIEIPDFKNFRIPIPSLIEQGEILDVFEIKSQEIDLSIKSAQREIEKAKEYQESLITQIVTGQLKV